MLVSFRDADNEARARNAFAPTSNTASAVAGRRPTSRVGEIFAWRRDITADTAPRLRLQLSANCQTNDHHKIFCRMFARIDRWLSRQAARPHGLVAPLIGRWLERENASINEAALAVLASAHEAVLEVGCGPGWALARLATRNPRLLVGADVAPAMVRRAGRRTKAFRALHRAGRLLVVRAPAEALPLASQTFDAALAVNALYFWQPPLRGLEELYRVLRPGGRLVLALEAAAALEAVGATAATGFATLSPTTVAGLCRQAGFGAVTVTTPAAGRVPIYVVHATVPSPSA